MPPAASVKSNRQREYLTDRMIGVLMTVALGNRWGYRTPR